MYDWKHRIDLQVIQGNRASSRGKGEVSKVFSSCAGNLRYILELWWGWTFKTHVSSVTSRLLSSYDGHLRNLNYACQDNMDASGVEAGHRGSLSSWHGDIGIPIHFQEVRHRHLLKH